MLRRKRAPSTASSPVWSVHGGPAASPVPAVSLLDALRPIAWVPGPYAVDFGDRLARTLITLRFPAEAWTDFLDPFFRLPMSRRMSWWIQPMGTDWALTQLSRRIDQLQATVRSNAIHAQSGDPHTTPALEDALILRQRLARQETRMLAVSFAVTLLTDGSDAPAQFAARKQEAEFLQQATAAGLWIFRNASFEQSAGFWSTAPVGRPPLTIPQELDAESVALMFPFIGGDILEPHGIVFGEHPGTHAPILVNWYDRALYPAAHMTVAAKTRAGKSMAIKYFLIQHLLRPDTEALVLDPSKPIDYQAISERLGTYIRLRPGSHATVNPLEIRYPEHYAELEPEDQALLDRKLEFVVPLVGLMIHPETGGRWADPYERAYVEKVCRELYTRAGITNDPASLLRPDTLTWTHPEYRPMPTLSDLQAAFAHEQTDLSQLGPRIATILDPWIRGTLGVFNGPTTVDLDQRLITLNVEALTGSRDDLRTVVHFVVGEILAQRMLTSRRRKMIVLDEAHVLFQNAETAQWAARLYRMAAKSNAQVVLITQGIRDLIGDPEHGLIMPGADQAQTCLLNSHLKFFMHQDTQIELDVVAREFHLTPDELRWIREAEPGEGVLVTHRYHVPVYVRVPDAIQSLVRSDPNMGAASGAAPDPLGGRRPVVPRRGSPSASQEVSV